METAKCLQCWPVLQWVACGEFQTPSGLLAAWSWLTVVTQVAAPLGEVSRSAGSRLGWSEPLDSTYSGARWQLYTWNLSPPIPTVPGGLGRPCEGTAGSSPSRGGLEECWEPVGAV